MLVGIVQILNLTPDYKSEMQYLSGILLLSCIVGCMGLCDQRKYGGELKCCAGKDSECFVHVRSNKTGEAERRICYCDTHCQFTDDCCSDMRKARSQCKVSRHCRVSSWSGWSGCSTACGLGVMRRKRHVTQLPSPGGKPCPPLSQVRGCNRNVKCNSNSYETAFILPISFRRPVFGEWLYEKILPASQEVYNDNPAHSVSKDAPTYSYCVNFKVTFKQTGCVSTWANGLYQDIPVCVECQSRVMDGGHCRGEGALGIRTRWKALGINRCYGDWIRLGPVIPNCTCSENYFSNYVFV